MTLAGSARSPAWALPSRPSQGRSTPLPGSMSLRRRAHRHRLHTHFRPRCSAPWWRRPITWSPFDQPLPAHALCCTVRKRAAPGRDISLSANPGGASSPAGRGPRVCSAVRRHPPRACSQSARRPHGPLAPGLSAGLSRRRAVSGRLRALFPPCPGGFLHRRRPALLLRSSPRSALRPAPVPRLHQRSLLLSPTSRGSEGISGFVAATPLRGLGDGTRLCGALCRLWSWADVRPAPASKAYARSGSRAVCLSVISQLPAQHPAHSRCCFGSGQVQG